MRDSGYFKSKRSAFAFFIFAVLTAENKISKDPDLSFILARVAGLFCNLVFHTSFYVVNFPRAASFVTRIPSLVIHFFWIFGLPDGDVYAIAAADLAVVLVLGFVVK